MKTQSAVINSICHSGELKTNRNGFNSLIKAIFAGLFIALGAFGNIVISSNTYATNEGLARFLGAVVFPVGLIGIVMMGFELFTSNCMNIIAVYNKKTTTFKFFRNILIVYIGNFLGCLLLGYITVRTHGFSENNIQLLTKMVNSKVNYSIDILVLKGIMCNILVVGAAILSYYADEVIGKIFAIWFPIMLFILLGYDHSIANMFYFSAAYFSNIDITISQMLYNLFFVTIGNFIGGVVLSLVLNIDRNL